MEEDHTRALQIVTWFTVITSILIVVTRVIIKITTVRSIKLDGYLVSAALLFAIGQTVAVATQTYHGYGKPLKASSQADLETDLKAGYVAALLYILALSLTKFAVLALIRTTKPIRKERRAVYAVAVTVCMWTFIGELATAFSCDVPEPWNVMGRRCIHRYAWWTFFETTNILTETALILLPLVCLYRRQASLAKKASAVSFFALRITVIIAVICKLVYLRKYLETPDTVLHTWPITICTQIIQCLSIVSACFPCLKPHCSEEGGSIDSGITRRKASSQSDMMNTEFSKAPMGLRDMTGGRHAASAVAGIGDQDASLHDQGSMSQAYMIKETKTFAVDQEALACRYC